MPEEQEDVLLAASAWLVQIPTRFMAMKQEDGEGQTIFLEGQVQMVATMVSMAAEKAAAREKLGLLLTTMIGLVSGYMETTATSQMLGKGVYTMARLLGPEGGQQLKQHVLALAALKDEIGHPTDLPVVQTSLIRKMLSGLEVTP
jgi:hypothetical protein